MLAHTTINKENYCKHLFRSLGMNHLAATQVKDIDVTVRTILENLNKPNHRLLNLLMFLRITYLIRILTIMIKPKVFHGKIWVKNSFSLNKTVNLTPEWDTSCLQITTANIIAGTPIWSQCFLETLRKVNGTRDPEKHFLVQLWRGPKNWVSQALNSTN